MFKPLLREHLLIIIFLNRSVRSVFVPTENEVESACIIIHDIHAMTSNLGVKLIFVKIFNAISTTKHNIIAGCIYSPPSLSLAKFIKPIYQKTGKLQRKHKYIFFTGYPNVYTLLLARGWISAQKKNVSSYCLPLTTKPTHVSNTCTSLIDNIYCSVPALANGCKSCILESHISDYYDVFSIDDITVVEANTP